MSLLKTINELVRPSARVPALLERVKEVVQVEEMLHSRGKEYSKTGFYQIRVRPTNESETRDEALYKIESHFKSIGFSEVQINVLSRNSSKFGSVSFIVDGIDYDVVVARGGNGGELFERHLIEKMNKIIAKEPVNAGYEFEHNLVDTMDKHVAGIESDEQAEDALKALRACDPAFKLSNIAHIEPRSGSTRRAKLSSEQAGEVIGDMVVVLKSGEKKYVSIKSFLGKSVSQFGVSKAFNDDLTVNPNSEEWKFWLQPFGLEPKKVEQGLRASQSDTDLQWPDVQKVRIIAKKNNPIYRIFERMWGSGYYYLRETRDGFHAFKVDRNFVDNVLLDNLTITEIRYPSKDRKQISIYAESKAMKFKIEVRNPRGRGSSRLTQIQLTITKNAL